MMARLPERGRGGGTYYRLARRKDFGMLRVSCHDKHEWYYSSPRTLEEVLLIKIFDSEQGGAA